MLPSLCRVLPLTGICVLLFAASMAYADEPGSPDAENSPPATTGLCTKVGEGGVGESGASKLLHHEVTGDREIVIVVRNVNTSLCPNTGAVALILVNGEPAAHGIITKPKNSVQVSAKRGDQVVAIVHTIPLFNGVSCIRLGNLEFTLEQCELE